MGTVNIKQENESTTKSTIFRAAAKLFAEKGYNGVSMREISERSGVTKPTIYYYFGSKEGIFKALIKEGLTYHTNDLKNIASLNVPAKQKLIELMKRRFQICVRYPELSKFFLSLFVYSENKSIFKSFEKEANEHIQIFMNIFQDGIDSGEFGATANPQLAVQVFAGVLTHFLLRYLVTKKETLNDQLAEDVVELLFKGLNE